nr:MAG TPA_asm: hypothetical protein [Caudoviricetes sp.]
MHLLAHAIGEGRALKDAGPGCPRGAAGYAAEESRQGGPEQAGPATSWTRPAYVHLSRERP